MTPLKKTRLFQSSHAISRQLHDLTQSLQDAKTQRIKPRLHSILKTVLLRVLCVFVVKKDFFSRVIDVWIILWAGCSPTGAVEPHRIAISCRL